MQKWRGASNDVDPRAAGNVRTFAVLGEQKVPSNPPRISAGAQGPQGQGFPSKGSAVINCLIKGGAEHLPLQPAQLRTQGTRPSPLLHPSAHFLTILSVTKSICLEFPHGREDDQIHVS